MLIATHPPPLMPITLALAFFLAVPLGAFGTVLVADARQGRRSRRLLLGVSGIALIFLVVVALLIYLWWVEGGWRGLLAWQGTL